MFGEATESDFATAGWTDSFTGDRISSDEMSRWADSTVSRVSRLRPARVLELGIGSGLIAEPLMKTCQEYWGVDLAESVIDRLEKQLTRGDCKLNLFPQAAHEEVNIPSGYFDVVVINSVAQYFSGLGYLGQVIQNAIRATRNGGHVYIGDLRRLDLMNEFNLAIALQRPQPEADADLLATVMQRARDESELLVHPDFFRTTVCAMPRVSAVRAIPRAGRDRNEMNCFRFDALLTVGDSPTPAAELDVVEWDATRPRQELLRECSKPVTRARIVRNIPLARLSIIHSAMDRLSRGESLPDNALSWRSSEAGFEPTELLSNCGGASAEIILAPCAPEKVHLLLIPKDALDMDACVNAAARLDRVSSLALSNIPVLSTIDEELSSSVRSWLQERLPAHYVPDFFHILESLPRTVHGKVDYA
jgi:ubiquinone/menaquinone biosynthesis C-methylase UbiE